MKRLLILLPLLLTLASCDDQFYKNMQLNLEKAGLTKNKEGVKELDENKDYAKCIDLQKKESKETEAYKLVKFNELYKKLDIKPVNPEAYSYDIFPKLAVMMKVCAERLPKEIQPKAFQAADIMIAESKAFHEDAVRVNKFREKLNKKPGKRRNK